MAALYCYPIKGLSAHALDRADLRPGMGFPYDRIVAVARADGAFEPERPVRVGKSNFLQLVKHERLAGLQTQLDPQTMVLQVRLRTGQQVHRADLSTQQGREATADFLAAMLEVPVPNVVMAPGMRFTDEGETSESMMHAISLINVTSVADLAARIGAAVDPMRFRANVYVEGWPPFSELEWVGREIALGGSRLRIVKVTERCAATEVNVRSARRDLPVPQLLKQHYGHALMGVYLQVSSAGSVRCGDSAMFLE